MRASSRIMRKATLLLEDQSPTLDAVIDVCLKWSRNEYAETLLRSLAPAGAEATAEAGLAVVNETLAQLGREAGALRRSRRIGAVEKRLPVAGRADRAPHARLAR